eukprot:2127228-Prymnesium_polylepis.1
MRASPRPPHALAQPSPPPRPLFTPQLHTSAPLLPASKNRQPHAGSPHAAQSRNAGPPRPSPGPPHTGFPPPASRPSARAAVPPAPVFGLLRRSQRSVPPLSEGIPTAGARFPSSRRENPE